MKPKTIESILNKKFAEFLGSITDESLRDRVAKGTIITGGCIASMLLKEKVSDYDMYFVSRDLARDVAEYYVARFLERGKPQHKDGRDIEIRVEDKGDRIHVRIQSAGIAGEGGSNIGYAYFEMLHHTAGDDWIEEQLDKREGKEEEKDYRPIFLSSNAITLSGGVQLIVRFFGEPKEIHASYDFVHCTNYWEATTGLHLNQPALESLMARELFYVGSRYPLCSIIRTRKFIQRGWTINAGQYLKMALQLNELELLDRNILEEQLIGVDSAYFSQVIEAVSALEPEKMNTAYISAIIDRIF